MPFSKAETKGGLHLRGPFFQIMYIDCHPREHWRLRERIAHFYWVEISEMLRPYDVENRSVKVGIFASRVLFSKSMLSKVHSAAG